MILSVADDFTGAAEVAGVAWRFGLQAEVMTRLPATLSKSPEKMVAGDADSRTEDVGQSAEMWRKWIKFAEEIEADLFFKKTDSVLRGHVGEELRACLQSGQWSRALLVPANPDRGRTICEGLYRLKGKPLDETEFSRDPEFPCRSALVTETVKGASSVKAGEDFSASEITVGDAEKTEDLIQWAHCVDDDILPAGASPFFAELLRARGYCERRQGETIDIRNRPAWLVSGSRSEQALATTARLEASGGLVIDADQGSGKHEVREDEEMVIFRQPRKLSADSPAELTERLAILLGSVLRHRKGSLPHLYLEGGETAAAILTKLNRTCFSVVCEWEPGVVTLESEGLFATVKPGSYPWPTPFFS